MTDTVKYILDEERLPKSWYNIVADLPEPPPDMISPATREPISAGDLEPLFSRSIIEQELSTERWIDIPAPVRDIYRQWRPTPLFRARRLESALQTPAKIYYKYEGCSPSGSHKTNTAIPQAFLAKSDGVKKLTTETGAGQWGSAISLAGSLMSLEIEVFMVKVSYEQKPYRRAFMQSFGGNCIVSPSDLTQAGRDILAKNPGSTGSLGIAISEAVERALQHSNVKYALGSVLNHVLLHQTVIGLEAVAQMEMADDYPDIVIGCTGGGSNFAGIAFPFIGEWLRGGRKVDVIAAEPASCPTLTKGGYDYDFGDTAMLTPLMKMHSLGSGFMPPGIHAGGLRYHGMAPLVSLMVHQGLARAQSFRQLECFEAGLTFARAEGILPAPEATHAVKAAIDAALHCKATGEDKTILFNLSGHGYFDMQAYIDYNSGKLASLSSD